MPHPIQIFHWIGAEVVLIVFGGSLIAAVLLGVWMPRWIPSWRPQLQARLIRVAIATVGLTVIGAVVGELYSGLEKRRLTRAGILYADARDQSGGPFAFSFKAVRKLAAPPSSELGAVPRLQIFQSPIITLSQYVASLDRPAKRWNVILLTVESLGAKFIDTGVDARGQGGYARELTQEEKDKIAAVVTKHIQAADVIITTAAIPGRPSPKLISKAQVDGMKPGAVIIDLAAEGGGNVEYTKAGETIRVGNVTIAAPLNVPSLLAEHASELYAKNLLNFLELIVKDGNLSLNWDDEVVAKTCLTHGGAIKNEAARKAVEGA